jgi:phosphatidylserine/phosphatidylglycerophosphate/cardiolipin synthase-like enzyme
LLVLAVPVAAQNRAVRVRLPAAPRPIVSLNALRPGVSLTPSAVRVAPLPTVGKSLALPKPAALPLKSQVSLARPAAPVSLAVPMPEGRLGARIGQILERVFPARPSEAPLPDAEPAKVPRKAPTPSYDYARMFELSRRLLTRPGVRAFLRETFAEELTITEQMRKDYKLPEDFEKVKDMSESQFMLLLQNNEEHWPLLEQYLEQIEKKEEKVDEDDPKLKELKKEWKAKFRELVADEGIREKFAELNDPLQPFELTLEKDAPGYSNARVYADHQKIVDGKVVPADDLSQVVVDFIDGAEKELMFNVFDFDLEKVADAFIRAAGRGVAVTGGVDGALIDKKSDSYRPQVEAVFKKLSATKGVSMTAVDAVGLNHQKMIIRDFNDPKKAKSLFSSGNFTQSCIGPEGDLCQVDPAKRPKDSVPNANHQVVMDGYLMAQVAANSLTKTLVMGLRGNEYPLAGAFKVFGAKTEKGDAPYMAVSFTPGGAVGNINRDMTSRLLKLTRGPVRLMQFAFSSEEVRQALVERAALEKKDGKAFDLRSVGDTPFALRPWSVSLALSGLYLDEDGQAKEYKDVKASENELLKILGKEGFEELRKNIRVGPRAYRTHSYTDEKGEKTEYGAKVHHKVLISGDFAILGTSFNFSDAANHNQEQFLLTNDPALVGAMNQVFDGLFALSGTSVVDEALRRNEFLKNGGEDDLKIDKQYDHVDKESAKSRKK